jgi:hypothetical protein
MHAQVGNGAWVQAWAALVQDLTADADVRARLICDLANEPDARNNDALLRQNPPCTSFTCCAQSGRALRQARKPA